MHFLSASVVSFLGLSSLAAAAPSREIFDRISAKRPVIEKRVPHQEFKNDGLQKRADTFLNSKTRKFAVDGTAIPDVDFDIGESYAGLLPISGDADETRELFFWFFPTTNEEKTEEFAIWLNGGPGCSSLSGLLTENGPFTWEAGTLTPVQNPYTWVSRSWFGHAEQRSNHF